MPADSSLFTILGSVDSTNNYAMARVHSGAAKHGSAWFAMEQTQGRGRMGRSWQSETGKNILLSIVIDASRLEIYQQFCLSAAVAVGCYDLFSRYDKINTKLKWPNDLYWCDRKAGGVLIENVVKGNLWQWSVIGIGINVNQTYFGVDKNQPVSLKLITGKIFDAVELGREVHMSVLQKIDAVMNGGFKLLLAEYNAVLYKRGEKVRLRKQNVIFETTIKEVTPSGQLKTIDTMERYFESNEVEFVA